jgi:hypothetical protein
MQAMRVAPPRPTLVQVLRSLERKERKYVKRLRVLNDFYATGIMVEDTPLRRLKEGLTIDVEVESLLRHHDALLQALRWRLQSEEEMEGAAEELLGAIVSAFHWYYSYAAKWLENERAIQTLLISEVDAKAVAEQVDLKKLRRAPLLQIGLYARLFGACLPSDELCSVAALETWIAVVCDEESNCVRGAESASAGVELFVDEQRFELCWFHLLNALSGQSDHLRQCSFARKVHRVAEYLYLVGILLLIALFFLCLFEQPSWCYGLGQEGCSRPPASAPPGSVLLNSNIPYLSVKLGIGLELALLAALFCCFSLPELLSLQSVLWVPLIKVICFSLAMMSVVIDLILASFGVYDWVHPSLWMRPFLFLLCTRSGLQAGWNVLLTLRSAVPLLLVLLGFVTLSAVVASALWAGSSQFGVFLETMSTLQSTLMTINYPDVMITQYTNSRWSVLFFIVYVSVGNFFLLALLLGEIRHAYSGAADKRLAVFQKHRDSELRAAFATLAAKRSWIPREDFCHLLATVSAFYPWMSYGEATKRRQELRADILLGEEDVCTLSVWMENVHDAILSDVEAGNATLLRFYSGFGYSIVLVCFGAACVTLCAVGTWGVLSRNHYVATGVFWATQVLMLFVLAECGAKVVAYGRAFWENRGGEFSLLLSAVIVDSVAIALSQQHLVVIWCCFGVVRVAGHWKFLSALFRSLQKLYSLFLAMVPLLVALYLSFAWLGIYLFGGKVYIGQPLLFNTTFSASNYYIFNWNDVVSALVAQFVWLVQNNGYILTDGLVAVTTPWARLFFYTFWILTVLILLNLFFALVFRAVDFAKADLNAQKAKKKNDALGGKKILAGVLTEKEREESSWISLRDGEYAVEMAREFAVRTRAARGASLVFSVPLTPVTEETPPAAP